MRIHPLNGTYKELTVEKARIIAHLIADGCICQSGTNYHIKYSSNDTPLLEQFTEDIQKVYGLQCNKSSTRSGITGKQLPYVYFRSKNVHDDLRQYSKSFKSREWTLPTQIHNASQCIKIAFVQAFFDDEGTRYVRNGTIVIRAYSTNKTGLVALKEVMKSVGIETSLKAGFGAARDVYGLEIINVEQFMERVGFSLERKR